MIRSKKLLIKFTIIIQTLMLLFAAVVVPAVADDSQGAIPERPINVDGEIYVNGEKAPEGTLITVKVNGEDVGSTVVTTEGVYGDGFGNKLPIPCELEDYSDLEFYINGEKVKVDPVINTNDIDSDGFLTLKINAEVSEENAKPKVSGGMGGSFKAAAEEPETGSISQEEAAINDIESEAPLGIEEAATSSAHEKSIPVDEGSNTMLIIACGLGLLLAAGLLMYKSKKKQKE
ncbi:hypothetical protein FTO70_09480 [Methanosarcina sp. KYL-1]|uniref:hypothetical protein n=1 Tax=Methanosarcina sp. KYL-1 TaxID=2602068 RepID=UPI002100F872|nr:hypothetical protein [Methanosarcina sp. KYL-1]MCQ1535905.1 hypothetical protein [Methanosarcina sp. KYL-1]